MSDTTRIAVLNLHAGLAGLDTRLTDAIVQSWRRRAVENGKLISLENELQGRDQHR